MAIAIAASEPTGCVCEDPNGSNGAVDTGTPANGAPAPRGNPRSRILDIGLSTLAAFIGGGGPAAAAIAGENGKNVVSNSGGGGGALNSTIGSTCVPSWLLRSPVGGARASTEALGAGDAPSKPSRPQEGAVLSMALGVRVAGGSAEAARISSTRSSSVGAMEAAAATRAILAAPAARPVAPLAIGRLSPPPPRPDIVGP